jgi:hypothetical protein
MIRAVLRSGGEKHLYIYPDNLKQKATMWLWRLSDLSAIGIAGLISILLLTQLHFFPPVVFTAVYAFLTIQFDGASVKDFLRYAVNYFIAKPQFYVWEADDYAEAGKAEQKKTIPFPARRPQIG